MDKENFKRNLPSYTCREYREEMILLGLRQRLKEKDLSIKEREEIEKHIRKLEEKMGLS